MMRTTRGQRYNVVRLSRNRAAFLTHGIILQELSTDALPVPPVPSGGWTGPVIGLAWSLVPLAPATSDGPAWAAWLTAGPAW